MINFMSMIITKFAVLVHNLLIISILMEDDGQGNQTFATVRAILLFFFILSLSLTVIAMFNQKRKK